MFFTFFKSKLVNLFEFFEVVIFVKLNTAEYGIIFV